MTINDAHDGDNGGDDGCNAAQREEDCAAGSGASDGDKVWVGEINGMTGIPWPDRLHNNSISNKFCSIWV